MSLLPDRPNNAESSTMFESISNSGIQELSFEDFIQTFDSNLSRCLPGWVTEKIARVPYLSAEEDGISVLDEALFVVRRNDA